mmetsp:Transcript_64260/g.123634  ORF Transcript_64260/g.123634 Transcript_64260/m.123634 type:complete len:227 (-) Transcript_64260:98-778(-)
MRRMLLPAFPRIRFTRQNSSLSSRPTWKTQINFWLSPMISPLGATRGGGRRCCGRLACSRGWRLSTPSPPGCRLGSRSCWRSRATPPHPAPCPFSLEQPSGPVALSPSAAKPIPQASRARKSARPLSSESDSGPQNVDSSSDSSSSSMAEIIRGKSGNEESTSDFKNVAGRSELLRVTCRPAACHAGPFSNDASVASCAPPASDPSFRMCHDSAMTCISMGTTCLP